MAALNQSSCWSCNNKVRKSLSVFKVQVDLTGRLTPADCTEGDVAKNNKKSPKNPDTSRCFYT